MSDSSSHLNVLGLGCAVGISWGLGIFIMGLFATYFNWGVDFVNVLGSLYIGYCPTLVGSFIGLIWALVDGFIGGVVIAWLYNYFSG